MYLSLGQAARETGKSKSLISNALKTGRLSGVRTGTGGWEIDPAELFRVFPRLNPAEPQEKNDLERTSTPHEPLVELLREQLRKAEEREQQAIRDRERLLALLEQEQAARRDLEMKLLAPPPAPVPQPDPPRRHHRLLILVLILVAAVAALVWTRTSASWPLGA